MRPSGCVMEGRTFEGKRHKSEGVPPVSATGQPGGPCSPHHLSTELPPRLWGDLSRQRPFNKVPLEIGGKWVKLGGDLPVVAGEVMPMGRGVLLLHGKIRDADHWMVSLSPKLKCLGLTCLTAR